MSPPATTTSLPGSAPMSSSTSSSGEPPSISDWPSGEGLTQKQHAEAILRFIRQPWAVLTFCPDLEAVRSNRVLSLVVKRWEESNRWLAKHQLRRVPPYCPPPEHWEILLGRKRLKAITGGERAGKSRFLAQFQFGMTERDHLYWFVGRRYEDTDQEHEFLQVLLRSIGAYIEPTSKAMPGVQRSTLPGREGWEIRCRAPLAGAVIRSLSVGQTDASNMAREEPRGITICEPGVMPPGTRQKMLSRSAYTLDGDFGMGRPWVNAAGTLEDRRAARGEWFRQLVEEWKDPRALGSSHTIPSWTNRVRFPGGRYDEGIVEMESDFSPGEFAERVAGRAVKSDLLVHPEFERDVHVVSDVPFEGWPTDTEVQVAIDPGFRNYAVLAIQVVGETVFVLDEVRGRRLPPERVIELAQRRPWGRGITRGVVDVAGRTGVHGPTHSDEALWFNLAGVSLIGFKQNLDWQIERLATFFEDPARRVAWAMEHVKAGRDPEMHEPSIAHCRAWARVFIHERCVWLIDELLKYSYPQQADGSRESADPQDALNHSIKGLAYFLLGRFGRLGEQPAYQQARVQIGRPANWKPKVNPGPTRVPAQPILQLGWQKGPPTG